MGSDRRRRSRHCCTRYPRYGGRNGGDSAASPCWRVAEAGRSLAVLVGHFVLALSLEASFTLPRSVREPVVDPASRRVGIDQIRGDRRRMGHLHRQRVLHLGHGPRHGSALRAHAIIGRQSDHPGAGWRDWHGCSSGAAVGAARRSAAVHKRLAEELQAAADSERTRLSHELHDEVAQKLAALKMQIQLADIAPHSSRVATSSVAIVDDLPANVRAISHSLRPAPFDRGQPVPALTAMARAEGSRGGLRVLIESPVADLLLPHEIELACYRVVREAVANAVKHARAQNVGVSLNHQSDWLTLCIVDDGRGFDVSPTTRQAVRDGHLGLVGMRERLDRVGGTLNISSTVGRGMTIKCLVPIGVAA